MNFLLITTEYPPQFGGVANYYENLVKNCPPEHKILVLDSNKQKIVNSNLIFFSWLPAFLYIFKSIKSNKIDHILVGQILPLGLPAFLISLIFKIKYSIILHGMDFTFAIKKKRKKILTKFLLKHSDKIICSNTYLRKIILDFINDSNKITTVNPGVNLKNIFTDGINLELIEKYNLYGKIILLSVGRLVKRKGFDKVIEALPNVLGQEPKLIYVIIGNGQELQNLESQIMSLKLQNSVIIIKNTSDQEKNVWYDICNIFIMPSRKIDADFEGFGIVYLEANLAGKPVIAGKSGGVGDAVINGVNGLMVNPESIDEISQAIVTLARDGDLRKKLGKNGKDRTINEFNWQKQTNKFYGLFK